LSRASLPLRETWQPICDALAAVDLELPAPELPRLCERAFRDAQVDTGNPRYFGVPHGHPGEPAIAGAAMSARHNPELASRHHAPFAVAAERKLVRAFAARFYGGSDAGGIITGGASEAVLSALLAALARKAPTFPKRGLGAFPKPPRVYASIDAHPSILKAVRATGLGDDAVRWVTCDGAQRMSLSALAQAIGNDRRDATPLFVVATAGTTTSGAFDPLAGVAELAARDGCFLHVDAAYGGMLALLDPARPELAGIDRADSVAFDPHKTLPVPLGLGLLLLKEPALLARPFAVPARYVPRTHDEPWATSLPWSRGFRGLPLLLEIAKLGFVGLRAGIEQKLALGRLLRERLAARGFAVTNESPLPVVCFVDATSSRGRTAKHLTALATSARKSAGAFVSLVRMPDGAPALRATVTSDATTIEDLDALVAALDAGRSGASGS
jgi:aromatic-L-amino-acid/L-tryptophan decarboxylase